MSDGDALLSGVPAALGAPDFNTGDALPRSLTSAVYERLRREILICQLEPDERLRVTKIKDRFNVSLSIVREALSRLVADGLVRAVDQIGFRVSPLSKDDIVDITRLRIELECVALRMSIGNGDAAWKTLCAAPTPSSRSPPPPRRPGVSQRPGQRLRFTLHDAVPRDPVRTGAALLPYAHVLSLPLNNLPSWRRTRLPAPSQPTR